jgi:hypothetical protein
MNFRNILRHTGLALPLLCALSLIAPRAAHAQFLFTNFDGPGDHAGGTTVNGLNNNGAEVGFSANAGASVLTNFIRNTDGTFTTLTLATTTDMANGINKTNEVVGVSGTSAFLLNGGSLTTLPPANPASTASQIAFGINDKGVIVGQYTDSVTGNTPGFVDNNGTFTLLNPTATATVTNAQGINDNGLVTGFYSADGVHQHGFLYDTTAATFTLLPDPSTAHTIADGLVLTQFLGINDMGEASGYYQTNNGSQFGFLFDTATDTYTYLDDPLAAPVNGVQITQITGINDLGELSGFFIDANGVQRGFFAQQVPEPGLCTLLASLGVSGACLLRRRRRDR